MISVIQRKESNKNINRLNVISIGWRRYTNLHNVILHTT